MRTLFSTNPPLLKTRATKGWNVMISLGKWRDKNKKSLKCDDILRTWRGKNKKSSFWEPPLPTLLGKKSILERRKGEKPLITLISLKEFKVIIFCFVCIIFVAKYVTYCAKSKWPKEVSCQSILYIIQTNNSVCETLIWSQCL